MSLGTVNRNVHLVVMPVAPVANVTLMFVRRDHIALLISPELKEDSTCDSERAENSGYIGASVAHPE